MNEYYDNKNKRAWSEWKTALTYMGIAVAIYGLIELGLYLLT